MKSSLPFTKELKCEYLLKENSKNQIVAHDLKGTIYNLDKLEERKYNVGNNNLLERLLLLIKASTDEERRSIAEGSEMLMDVVTQIRKFLYDEETKEMKNIQDKWKEEARDEGLKEGREQTKIDLAVKLIGKLSLDEIAQVTGLSKDLIAEKASLKI